MFTFWDHLSGAITVRFHRFFLNLKKKPDATFIEPNLFVGGSCKISRLKKIGIQAILDLRNEDQNDKIEIKKHLINYLRLPIPNRGIPSLEDSIMATKWLQTQIENNKIVFIHCNLGRGRSPLMTIFYLISIGVGKADAINLIKDKRPFTFLNKKQMKMISQFERKINN